MDNDGLYGHIDCVVQNDKKVRTHHLLYADTFVLIYDAEHDNVEGASCAQLFSCQCWTRQIELPTLKE